MSKYIKGLWEGKLLNVTPIEHEICYDYIIFQIKNEKDYNKIRNYLIKRYLDASKGLEEYLPDSYEKLKDIFTNIGYTNFREIGLMISLATTLPDKFNHPIPQLGIFNELIQFADKERVETEQLCEKDKVFDFEYNKFRLQHNRKLALSSDIDKFIEERKEVFQDNFIETFNRMSKDAINWYSEIRYEFLKGE